MRIDCVSVTAVVLFLNRNEPRETLYGKCLCFPIFNKEFFFKYVIFVDKKSICFGDFMLTGFAKNVVELGILLCSQFVVGCEPHWMENSGGSALCMPSSGRLGGPAS